MKRKLYKWSDDYTNVLETIFFFNHSLMSRMLLYREKFKRGRVVLEEVYKKNKDKAKPRRLLDLDDLESIEFHGRIEFAKKKKNT